MNAPRQSLGLDIGAELEASRYDPHIKGGQVLSGGVVTNPVQLTATFVGANLLVRFPIGATDELPNGRWFPYFGIGGGIQSLRFKTDASTEGRDPSPAVQVLGGLKVFLFKNLAIFGEAKFTHAQHTLEFQASGVSVTDKFDLNTVHGVGGISLHF